MKIRFQAIGLWFDAEVTYTPGDPGFIGGPPERCYPPESAELEFESLKCGESDALFLLESQVQSAICEAAEAAAEFETARLAEPEVDERDFF